MSKKISAILVSAALMLTLLSGCLQDPHQHSFLTEWSVDSQGHWHGAACEHTDVKADAAYHTFDGGVEHPATFTEKGYTVYTCTVCGYEKKEYGSELLQHTYADSWSFDDVHHWHACLDVGFAHLRADEGEHEDTNEEILQNVTDSATGLARYTCGVCGHSYEKELKLPVSLVSAPAAAAGTYYVGQKLQDVVLVGGEASVEGSFQWKYGEETIAASGEYAAQFVPADSRYGILTVMVVVTAQQLYITVEPGQHGTADPSGQVPVGYGESLTIRFAPDVGYAVSQVTVDGAAAAVATFVTLENITKSQTVQVRFQAAASTLSIECISGTPGCYAIDGNTVTFSGITAESIYAISGTFHGNIVINAGDNYRFELEMRGLNLTCDETSPITILSGDKVTLTAKKGYENTVTDLRQADVPNNNQKSGAIYAECDLEIGGKGKLTVVSQHNNGIHTKDDLEIKNLTLTVRCADNALKGNDSVTIKSGVITLYASAGDGIKTVNTDVSSKGKQRGIVTVLAGTVTIYAAQEGIDAAYDTVINETDANVKIYPYTEQ